MSTISDAKTFGDVLRGNAKTYADKVAFETLEGRTLTFEGFNQRVNRLCNSVAAKGISAGTRVAILSKNRPEYLEVFGLAKLGVIVVPLNWRLAPKEIAKLLKHSSPEMLIVDETYLSTVERIKADLPSIASFVTFGQACEGWEDYEELLAAGDSAEPLDRVRPDDVLTLIYTSGTTGEPKGVAVSHAGALGNCRTAAGEMLDLVPEDRALAVMPLFHAGGMWYHLFPSFATGCTTLILAEFEPGAVLREMESRHITNVHLVPTMIGALLAHPSAVATDLSGVRLIFYAASSMPADLLRRAMLAFPRCGFAQGYGSTEGGVVSVLGPDAHLRAKTPEGEHLLSSCGRAFTGHEIRLVDDSGRTVPQGSVGEIEVHSPDLMKGYWLNDEATNRVLSSGWLKTGDLGYFDNEGYLYIVDRKNDMVVTGGENVFPNEVEGCLFRDPDVLEAAVFGIPDPQWVERVVAAVVLREGATVTADELIARLRGQLAAYKCPKEIYFMSTLPKSAVGKVLRKELRQQWQP
jgi:long-chain acyl-CoA synthetase